jgi:hypothetical protein
MQAVDPFSNLKSVKETFIYSAMYMLTRISSAKRTQTGHVSSSFASTDLPPRSFLPPRLVLAGLECLPLLLKERELRLYVRANQTGETQAKSEVLFAFVSTHVVLSLAFFGTSSILSYRSEYEVPSDALISLGPVQLRISGTRKTSGQPSTRPLFRLVLAPLEPFVHPSEKQIGLLYSIAHFSILFTQSFRTHATCASPALLHPQRRRVERQVRGSSLGRLQRQLRLKHLQLEELQCPLPRYELYRGLSSRRQFNNLRILPPGSLLLLLRVGRASVHRRERYTAHTHLLTLF